MASGSKAFIIFIVYLSHFTRFQVQFISIVAYCFAEREREIEKNYFLCVCPVSSTNIDSVHRYLDIHTQYLYKLIYSQSTVLHEGKKNWIAYLSALNCIAIKQQHFYIFTLNIQELANFMLALLLQYTRSEWKHIWLKAWQSVSSYLSSPVRYEWLDRRKSHLTTSTSEWSKSRTMQAPLPNDAHTHTQRHRENKLEGSTLVKLFTTLQWKNIYGKHAEILISFIFFRVHTFLSSNPNSYTWT